MNNLLSFRGQSLDGTGAPQTRFLFAEASGAAEALQAAEDLLTRIKHDTVQAIREMHVVVGTAPGASQTYTFHVFGDGATQGNVVISGTALSGTFSTITAVTAPIEFGVQGIASSGAADSGPIRAALKLDD